MKYTLFLTVFLSAFYFSHSQETFQLSSKSNLTIDGTSTLHDWTVKANELNGNTTVEKNIPKTIMFEVSVDEILSERGATMDKKMHEALKSDEHPKVVFKLKEVSDSNIIKGKLTMAGHERSIEIPVKMSSDSSSLNINGKYTITLKDYGMEPPTAMFGQIVVGDTVTVNFDLIFSKN